MDEIFELIVVFLAGYGAGDLVGRLLLKLKKKFKH